MEVLTSGAAAASVAVRPVTCAARVARHGRRFRLEIGPAAIFCCGRDRRRDPVVAARPDESPPASTAANASLVRLGLVDATSLCEALVQQAGLPTANLDEQTPDEQTLRHVPSQFAFQHKLIPIHANGQTLSVAMANPFDAAACEAVRVLTGK